MIVISFQVAFKAIRLVTMIVDGLGAGRGEVQGLFFCLAGVIRICRKGNRWRGQGDRQKIRESDVLKATGKSGSRREHLQMLLKVK